MIRKVYDLLPIGVLPRDFVAGENVTMVVTISYLLTDNRNKYIVICGP
jgi:hypothetical protein